MTDADTIIGNIRADGHRLTRIRVFMIRTLFEAQRPLAPSEILTRLAGFDIRADRTTVYRELRFLMEQNIVGHIKLGDHRNYYEILTEHHHHLVCKGCKNVKAVVLDNHLEDEERKIYKKEKFKVISHSLEFYGLCDSCLRKRA